MTNKFYSLRSLSIGNGSGLDRRRIGDGSVRSYKFFILLFVLLLGFGQMWGANKTYTKITSTSSLSTGDKCLIVCESQTNNSGDIRVFKASAASDGRAAESEYISMSNSSITCNENYAFTLTSANGTDWKITGTNGSIGHTSSGNTLSVNTTNTNTISFSNGNAVIGCDSRVLRCNANNGSPLFRYYSNTQQAVQLYKEVASSTPSLSISDNATSLAMGDAKVNGSGVTNNTLSFSGSNLPANVSLSISGTNASMFSVLPTSVNKGTGTITNQSITITYNPTSAGSHEATLTISSGTASKTITLTGTGKYEVIWQNNGDDYTTTLVASGSRPTLPDAPTSCDTGEGASTTFYGWATSTWSGKAASLEDSKLSGITIYTNANNMPTVTGNGVVYNAVFCKGGAISYATSITANDVVYLATAANGSGVTGYDGTKDATTSTDNSEWMPFTVSSVTGGYNLTNGTNKVIAASSSFKVTTGTASTLTFEQQGSTGQYRMIWTSGTDKYALGINGSYKRFYKTSNSYTWFYVFKASAGTNYMTSCCTSLGQINGSFFWTTHFCPVWPAKHRS